MSDEDVVIKRSKLQEIINKLSDILKALRGEAEP